MGLKSDREIRADRIDVYLNEAANRGEIVTASTYASGVALDNTAQLGTVAADPSGQVVLGVLVGDMKDIDVTRQFLNTQKDESVKGSKMRLVTQGWIVTDNIEASAGTITAGEAAYVGVSGQFANAADVANYGATVTEESNATTFRMVGRFETIADENGYAKISLDIS